MLLKGVKTWALWKNSFVFKRRTEQGSACFCVCMCVCVEISFFLLFSTVSALAKSSVPCILTLAVWTKKNDHGFFPSAHIHTTTVRSREHRLYLLSQVSCDMLNAVSDISAATCMLFVASGSTENSCRMEIFLMLVSCLCLWTEYDIEWYQTSYDYCLFLGCLITLLHLFLLVCSLLWKTNLLRTVHILHRMQLVFDEVLVFFTWCSIWNILKIHCCFFSLKSVTPSKNTLWLWFWWVSLMIQLGCFFACSVGN